MSIYYVSLPLIKEAKLQEQLFAHHKKPSLKIKPLKFNLIFTVDITPAFPCYITSQKNLTHLAQLLLFQDR